MTYKPSCGFRVFIVIIAFLIGFIVAFNIALFIGEGFGQNSGKYEGLSTCLIHMNKLAETLSSEIP